MRRAHTVQNTHKEAAVIQTAVKVGAANDPLEHEAEATADQVVSMPAPAADAEPPPPREPTPELALMRAMPDQESQPDTEVFETAPDIPADHQDPDVPATEDVDTAGLENDEFAEIEGGEPDVARDGDDSPAAVVGAEGGAAPADVARAVAQPGSGRPLPASVRNFMEPRFGYDFSDVRIHDSPADRHVSERIGARAFTHRHHIWMGEGETTENRRLMAHELTHVVQQTSREARQDAKRVEVEGRDREGEVQRGWAADKAEKVARNVPGYTLLTVILGKSPITGNRVERNATNLVGGFLGLIPGGEQIFQKLKETRALERAFEWVRTRLAELNITWSRIKGLVSDFIDEMPAWSPLKVAKRIFRPLVRDIITFVKDIKDKILEFIVRGALALAGPWGEKVWGIIEKARETISLILSDPLGFAKNLVNAVVKGFKQFGSRIWEHLKKGLLGWLFGTLQGMEIELPAKLDFKGIVSIVLQILGLTYAKFRAMLVKKLGKGGEKKVAFLEKSVEVVKILLKEGFLGVWQRLLSMIEGFKQTVIGGIQKFVVETVVMGAVSWIAGLSNPVGAIVKVCLSIYNMIKTFLERLDQILEVANSIFSSIGAIARGQIKAAADFIEKTIAASIPVFLAFVAALIPVTGITKTIQGIIRKIQKPIHKAMEKMVGFLVKKAKKLFSKILGKVNKKRKLPKKGFRIGKEAHDLLPMKKGNKFTLQIASDDPQPADKAQGEWSVQQKKAAEFGDDSKCVEAFAEAFKKEVDEAESALAKVKPEQQKTSTKQTGDKATKETDDAAKKLAKLGPCIADNPFLDDDPKDGAIIRAREPRIPEIEGFAGLYTERGKVTRQKIGEVATQAGLGEKGTQRLSNYYENDHIPEKSLGFKVQEYVQGPLKQAVEDGKRDGSKVEEPLLGDIDNRALGKKGEQLPAITIYRPIHRQKTSDDSGGRDHGGLISKADAKTTPEEKIGELRKLIDKEMGDELKNVADRYGNDEAATKAIRGNLRGGIGTLGTLNKVLFGFEPGSPPEVKPATGGADGSDLPLMGNGKDLPNFADLEGDYAVYKAKPKGVGNYLEYDHVIEATMAEKARDLDLASPAFTGGLSDTIDARAAEIAGAAEPANGEKAADPKRIAATGKGRITRLKGPAFAGKGVAAYDRNKAGTVGLYRPIHREVTAAHQEIKGDILNGLDLTAAREKLVDYAMSEPKDNAKREAAIGDLHKGVRGKFTTAIDTHIDLIKGAYQKELKDFMAINQSKPAAAKMGAVIERAGATLRTLRSESLAMLD